MPAIGDRVLYRLTAQNVDDIGTQRAVSPDPFVDTWPVPGEGDVVALIVSQVDPADGDVISGKLLLDGGDTLYVSRIVAHGPGTWDPGRWAPKP